MIDVVVLIPDGVSRSRVCEGMRSVARCVLCESAVDVWPALERTRARGDRVGAVVLAPRDRDGHPTDDLVISLRTRAPAVPVVAYCVLTGTESVEILTMARAGVSGLIRQGVDDAGLALRSAVASAGDDCAARHIMRALGTALPLPVRPVVTYCVLHARKPLTVAGVARALGVNRKTLAVRLAEAGLPQPREIIAWSRLCLVAHALEDGALPIERAAMDFGFPSAPALRNLCKRHTGLRLGEIRQNGGLACALNLFARALHIANKSVIEAAPTAAS